VDYNCRVYYADLWGKKKEKLAALDEATMDSVKWQEVQPTEPMLFFTPRDTEGETEWNNAFGVDELMTECSVGVVTGNDSVLVAYDKGSLLDNIATHFAETPNASACRKFAHCVFDSRYIYYDVKKLARPRANVMRHFASGDNLSLIVKRGFPEDNTPQGFIADGISNFRYWSRSGMQGGDYVFPLYLYEENMGKVEKRANLDNDIVAKIAAILNPVNPVNPVKETPSPEDIFDYIYGVLHSPAYRAKFKEFLKVDFPRIPYPKDLGEFARFRDAGHELRLTHLMKDAAPSVSELCACFPVAGDNTVDKVEWDNGRVYINATQYFDNVPTEAWEQQIGGYRPAEKYLKDRKNRALSQEELKHYQRIILALAKTREIMDGL
jgi:predicted helicase